MNIEEEIKRIATYHGDEGTSGYLLTDKEVDGIKNLFKKAMLEVIGEDNKEKFWANGGCIEGREANNLRQEQRERVNKLLK